VLRHREINRAASMSLLILLACLAAGPAQAGCSSPNGNEADQFYSSAYHTLQFCNGTYWVPFGSGGWTTGGGGGGCSNPTGNEGDQFYNGTYHTYQFCNGTNWISMTVGTVTGGGGAGCSSPAGQEGAQFYNGSYDTYQFCNGTNWINMGGGYIGPGDLVPGATAWYGLRGYSKAVAWSGTQKAINIRRASDNTTKDIYILTNGALDVSTASTFCASTTCYVTEAYDQSGNGYNISQGTTTAQPQLLLSGCGLGSSGLPCLYFNGSDYLVGNADYNTMGTFTTVAERSANFTTGMIIFSQQQGGAISFNGAANQISLYNGSISLSSVADSAWHAMQGVYGATNYLYADGTGTSVGGSTKNNDAGIAWGAFYLGTTKLTGYSTEAGIWTAGFTTAQIGTMCHNQYTYWGTSTSC
jgi:hypothetical protein